MIERVLLWLAIELGYQLRQLQSMPTMVVVMLWITGIMVAAIGIVFLYGLLFHAPWWVSGMILFCIAPPIAFKYYCGGKNEV
jgi:hypothetical protein